MRVALNGLFLDAPATGTGQYLREIVRAMRAQAPNDEFVFIAQHDDRSAPAQVVSVSTRIGRENVAKLEFEQATFPRAAKKGFDLAHVPHFGPPLYPTLPTVVTIHDLIPMVLPAYRGSARVQVYTRLAAAGARRAQAILADSDASAKDIVRCLNVSPERVHVVYLAADARYQPVSESEIARVRAKYDLPKRFVLYLGGFDVRKNVARVIETFAAQSQASDLWLVLAGKLPEQDSAFFPDPRRMLETFGVSDRARCVGFVAEEDKPALYAASRVFLYPSFYEGFGLPPLEAMASGTPVIVSNRSSLPEVVGDAGILLAPDDAQGWGEALGALLADESRWREMRARGIEQAKKFSWERAASETLKVYRAVV